MRKNLLVVKGLDQNIFFKDRSLEKWEILDIKEFVKNYKRIRRDKYQEICFGYYDTKDKGLCYFIEFLLIFIEAQSKYFIDNQGRKEKISFLKFLFIDTPSFILEVIFGLLLVIISWLTLFVFNLFPARQRLLRSFHSLAMTEKKIIYLRTDNFRRIQIGGSFTHFRGVLEGFDKLEYKIHYIGSGEMEVSKINFPKTIIFYPKKFNLPEIPDISYNWRFIPKAYKIITKEKPLFIYQRHSIFNVCGTVLSQLTGIPLILEYNGSEPWIRQKWGGLLIFKQLCYFMENFSLKRAKIITVVSKAMKEELIKRNIPESKILVNYNGVDVEEFNPNIDGLEIRKRLGIENEILIGSLSTFDVWHGIPVLAQAVQLIVNRIQDTRLRGQAQYRIHFLFIGDGVERPLCERIIKEGGMENYVTFTGTIPYQEIPKYLAACDILVSPHVPNPDGTPFFGSPTKIFEYMAIGKGIIASDLDQIGEVLEHQKTAWLVKPGDTNDLVYGIIKLICEETLRTVLGKNAREEVVKNYVWGQNVKRIISAYFKNEN